MRMFCLDMLMHVANIDSRKSQTGFVFTLHGTTISWKSSHQPIVALSTMETEFTALTKAVRTDYS